MYHLWLRLSVFLQVIDFLFGTTIISLESIDEPFCQPSWVSLFISFSWCSPRGTWNGLAVPISGQRLCWDCFQARALVYSHEPRGMWGLAEGLWDALHTNEGFCTASAHAKAWSIFIYGKCKSTNLCNMLWRVNLIMWKIRATLQRKTLHTVGVGLNWHWWGKQWTVATLSSKTFHLNLKINCEVDKKDTLVQ